MSVSIQGRCHVWTLLVDTNTYKVKKNRMLCFVLINSVLLYFVCVFESCFRRLAVILVSDLLRESVVVYSLYSSLWFKQLN